MKLNERFSGNLSLARKDEERRKNDAVVQKDTT